MATRFAVPVTQLVNDDALSVAAGWKLNFYTTGTTTNKDTFSDSGLTTANSNPVVADSAGRFGDIFLESGDYRVVLTDADDVEKWTADPVEGATASSGAIDPKTANYTVEIGDDTKVITVDASGGAVTVTLPTLAASGNGFQVTVKKTDNSSNTVTVDGNAAETIDGASTYVLSDQYDSAIIRGDGSTGWSVIAHLLGVPTQAEAEAGTATINRVWTAERVKQAVVALSPRLPRNYLTGLGMSNAADADHDITVQTGEARGSDDDEDIKLTSALTKQIDVTWVAGSNQGGLSSSLSAPANSTWYHVHAIVVGGAADIGFDTDVNAANLIADHSATAYRRIGSILTNGSANIIAFIQDGDEFYWSDPIQDVDENVATTVETHQLSVPTGVRVTAGVNIKATNSAAFYAFPTDVTEEAASNTLPPLGQVLIGAANTVGGYARVLTDTSGNIKVSQSVSGNAQVVTLSWTDVRGKL
ncbi:MAG: hypothetical protein ACPG4X_14735 [Pikeienuella sp.]